ncbi:hypothetical protein [Lysobacter tyrosinilyticus]
MKRSLLCLACLFALPCAAAADGIDLARLCPAAADASHPVDPVKVVYVALDAASTPVSRGAFDTNQDGNETLRERVDAIFDVGYCNGAGKDLCADGDAGSLDDVRLLLQSALGADIVAERVATPSAQDKLDWPLLADPEYGGIAEMLDERKRFRRLSCAERTASASAKPKPAASGTDRLRLTGDIESLSLPRGGPQELRAVTQAEVAYTDNRLEDSQTFQVSAFLGYDFAKAPHRQAIPFLGYEREQTKQSGPDDDGTSKISAGFLYAAEFESLDQLSLAPLYVADRIQDSRIATLRAAWTPGFLYGIDGLPMDGTKDIGPFAVRMNLQLRAQAGRVIDAGTSEDLLDVDDYVRLGPAFKLELWPRTERWLLSRITADAAYRHFFRLSGPHDVEWWSAGINYSIEPTDHVTVRYSYEQGEDEETLEKSKLWKLTFGVRF